MKTNVGSQSSRILIYGMQSSGASVLAMLLSQEPKRICFPDVWNGQLPNLTQVPDPMLAKFVCTTKYTWEQVQEMVNPTIRILFIRDPVSNCMSLKGKSYQHGGGLMWEKLARMDEVYESGEYDVCVRYESLMVDRKGIEFHLALHGIIESTYLPVTRDLATIRRDNGKYSKLTQWGERWVQGSAALGFR